MKLDKEFFLKHRFWVLLRGAVGLWLIGLAFVLIGPASTAAKARSDFAKDEDNLGPKNKVTTDIKNASFNEPWDKRREFYQHHKDDIWRAAWDTQTDLMTWPAGELSRKYTNAYFGDPIEPND